MSYNIILSPIAAKNLEDAIYFYKDLPDKKVVKKFILDYQKTLKALKTNPYFQFHDNYYRFLPFKKFPFVVFFIADEKSKTVFLNAIFHTSQNPKKYPKI
jgi:plasmid stabilization system protein ParE